MGIFSRKKKIISPPLVVAPPTDSRVEVELHKGASEEAAQKAKEANQHLTELLAANGFTLKIYLAAGGQLHQKKQGGHK